jgi:hypothetical protein
MDILIKLDSQHEGSELVTASNAEPGELESPVWGLYELPVYDDDVVHEWQYDLIPVAEGLTHAAALDLADARYPDARLLDPKE